MVSCDFAETMVEMVAKRYEDSDFCKLGGTAQIDTKTDYVNDESKTCAPEIGDHQKLVVGCRANNERLPFPDQWFDCYISNLSLMIVHDYRNQIKEAYRVLKPGSKACFTVWGKPDNCIQFTMMKRALERLGKPAPPKPAHDEFHLSQKQEELL